MKRYELLKKIISKKLEQDMKKARINGIVIGFEVCNKMLLDYSKKHTKKELIEFMKKNLENKEVMGKAIGGENELQTEKETTI